MATPSTVAVSGYFDARRAGVDQGEAMVRMTTELVGRMQVAGTSFRLTGNAERRELTGTWSGKKLSLKIKSRNELVGTVGNEACTFVRRVLRPIPAGELMQFDPGPSPAMQAVFDATPDYLAATGDSQTFWHNFGNVFYRGRLDGTARVLGIASDPGPVECLPFVRRCLVGDSGQKTQGFFSKIGLTRSYVLVNAFTVAMKPSRKTQGLAILKNHIAIRQARHGLYNKLLASGNVQAIVAFGSVAQEALDIWIDSNPEVSATPRFEVAHPAAVDREGTGDDAALKGWAKTVKALRNVVTADADGDAMQPNFGNHFIETDYVRIPRWDLPARAPLYVGDDSWGRAAKPRHNNCASRPREGDAFNLDLTPAPDQGQALTYRYENSRLMGARNSAGQNVPVDELGLES